MTRGTPQKVKLEWGVCDRCGRRYWIYKRNRTEWWCRRCYCPEIDEPVEPMSNNRNHSAIADF